MNAFICERVHERVHDFRERERNDKGGERERERLGFGPRSRLVHLSNLLYRYNMSVCTDRLKTACITAGNTMRILLVPAANLPANLPAKLPAKVTVKVTEKLPAKLL